VKPPHTVSRGKGWKPPQPKPGRKPPARKPPPAAHHKKPAKPKPPAPAKKPAPHKKPRQWSPGWDVACCSAEAVGLLLGWGWDEVLGLYWRTASNPDAGASIEDTLEAVMPGPRMAVSYAARDAASVVPGTKASVFRPQPPGIGLILGVSLPEPHAIAITPDGTWWSWGQPFNPHDWPELTIEEAWCLP
jgi:hypothetical protein